MQPWKPREAKSQGRPGGREKITNGANKQLKAI